MLRFARVSFRSLHRFLRPGTAPPPLPYASYLDRVGEGLTYPKTKLKKTLLKMCVKTQNRNPRILDPRRFATRTKTVRTTNSDNVVTYRKRSKNNWKKYKKTMPAVRSHSLRRRASRCSMFLPRVYIIIIIIYVVQKHNIYLCELFFFSPKYGCDDAVRFLPGKRPTFSNVFFFFFVHYIFVKTRF